jgi:eukaryotic-like serine/threonine-protein kinase
MTYPTGTIVGDRYEILRPLGSGGMAIVYLAVDIKNRDFKVALKVFHPNIVRSAEARERFRNEINAAYRVPHKNVVQVFEFFDDDNLFAFTMEYAELGDLYGIASKHGIPVPLVEDILLQVASGLNAIHEQGVVHRDLKPENIMVCSNNIYKISDFGVARLTGFETPTLSGHIVGTPRYVSPEYVANGKCDHRSDIFALGFMAFELLSGYAPYPEHQSEVLSKDRYQRILKKSLPEELSTNNPELCLIVERALAIQLSDRYQGADELISDLQALKSNTPLSLKTVRFGKLQKSFTGRKTTKRALTEAKQEILAEPWIRIANLLFALGLFLILALN